MTKVAEAREALINAGFYPGVLPELEALIRALIAESQPTAAVAEGKTLDPGSGGSAEPATREDADRGADRDAPRAHSAQPSGPVHHAEECERCDGDGYVNPGLHEKACPDCHGTGRRVEPAAGEAGDEKPCPTCDGRTITGPWRCPKCRVSYGAQLASAPPSNGELLEIARMWAPLEIVAVFGADGCRALYNAGKAATGRAAELLHRLIEQNPRYSADAQLQADLVAWHGGTFGKAPKCSVCNAGDMVLMLTDNTRGPVYECDGCGALAVGTGKSPLSQSAGAECGKESKDA